MKRIALVAFNHPESTLPLVKYLSEKGDAIDYYFITIVRFSYNAAFDYGGKLNTLGIKKMSRTRIPSMYNYFGNTLVNINLIGLVTPTVKIFGLLINDFFLSLWINKIIMYVVGKSLSGKKYDILNIVGQDRLLVDLHKSTQKVNKIHTLHEVADHSGANRRYSKLILYLFNNRVRLIVHSHTTYNRIIHCENCDKDLVTVIPFGLFETYRLFDNNLKLLEDSKNIILFYGFIRPYKGLKLLIDAIEILSDKLNNYRVVIAGLGDIPNKSELVRNNKYIILNHYLSNEEIVALNKQARFIVCPYLTGSQSGIIMTTFLFGKPIIASNIETFREIIEDGQNGLLFNPNASEELANCILKLLSDEDLYNHICKNIRMFGHSRKYAWKQIAKLTYDKYFEVNNLNNPYFTVFTSVYNGEKHIERVLDSMNQQIFRDFEWIIVNDGSIDNTSKIIRSYIKDHSEIKIIYLEQENSGKHIAWNRAVKLARGKLFVPADADDSFTPDTLSFFYESWNSLTNKEQLSLSGISVLCKEGDTDKIVGSLFPNDGMKVKIHELYYKHRISGEKWGCTRVDLLKTRPFPNMRGQYFPEDFLWLHLSKTYQVICFNKALRKYYTTDTGLTMTEKESNIPKHVKIKIRFYSWFIANHGVYLLVYAPVVFFRSLGYIIFLPVKKLFYLILKGKIHLVFLNIDFYL